MQSKYIYEEEFKIRSSEVAPNGKAKLQSICDLLQESAGNHALQLDFDISQLQQKNLTWVLHRLHVQIDRYPEWREVITIKTWPSSGDTLRAYRDFSIIDTEGQEIGRSLSYWLMLNTGSRRPVRMPKEVLAMAPKETKHVLDVNSSRIEAKQKMSGSKTFTVRRSDLDVNEHLNNVRYIEWALETLPETQNITELDIEFRTECTLGETIQSEYSSMEGQKNVHRITRLEDEKIAAVAISKNKNQN